MQLNAVLAWTPVVSDPPVLGYKIGKKVQGPGAYTDIGQVDAGVTTFTDPNVTLNTNFYYSVRAFNALGDGAFATASGNSGGLPVAPGEVTLHYDVVP